MKLLPVLLGLSLLANAVLLATRSATSARSAAPATTSDVANPHGTPVGPSAPAPAAGPATAVAWSQLAPGDLAGLPARLRAAGFPPDVIRAIVKQAVLERNAPQHRAILARLNGGDYWRTTFGHVSNVNEVLADLADLKSQELEEVTRLLGEPVTPVDAVGAAVSRVMYGDLPDDVLPKLQRLLRDYGPLQARNAGPRRADTSDVQHVLDTEFSADLAKILTPEQLENYELRRGAAAKTLREDLGTWEASESEFRALHAAIRAAEAKVGPITERENRAAINAAVLARAQTLLSPERYATFRSFTAFGQ